MIDLQIGKYDLWFDFWIQEMCLQQIYIAKYMNMYDSNKMTDSEQHKSFKEGRENVHDLQFSLMYCPCNFPKFQAECFKHLFFKLAVKNIMSEKRFKAAKIYKTVFCWESIKCCNFGVDKRKIRPCDKSFQRGIPFVNFN